MKRWLLRGLFAVVALGIGYLLIRLLWRFWAPIAFWIYVAVGVALAVFSAWRFIRTLYLTTRPDESDFTFTSFIRVGWGRMSKFDRFRTIVATPIDLIARATGWVGFLPANGIALHRTSGKMMDIVATKRLRAEEPVTALLLFVSLTLVALLHAVLPPPAELPGFRTYFAIGLVISVVARLAFYTINAESLGKRLRATIGRPYLQFLGIAICDFLSLVVGFGFLTGRGDAAFSALPTLAHLVDTAESLINPAEWRQLLSLANGFDLQWFLDFSGLVFSAAVISTLLQYKDFQRTDEDQIAIAGTLGILGRPNESLKHLAQVKNRGNAYYQARAMALLAVNEVDDAIAAMARGSEDSDPPTGMTRSSQAAYDLYMAVATIHPASKTGLIEILRRSPEFNFVPAQVLSILSLFQTTERASAAELLALFDGEPALRETYPLVHVALLTAADARDRAKEALAAIEPRTAFEQAYLRIAELRHATTAPDATADSNRTTVQTWFEEHFQEVKEACRSLENDHNRLAIATRLLSFHIMTLSFLPDREAEVVYLAEQVVAEIGNPQLAGAWEHIQAMHQNELRKAKRSR